MELLIKIPWTNGSIKKVTWASKKQVKNYVDKNIVNGKFRN